MNRENEMKEKTEKGSFFLITTKLIYHDTLKKEMYEWRKQMKEKRKKPEQDNFA